VAAALPSTPLASPTVAIDLEQVPPGALVFVDGQPLSSRHLTFVRGSTHQLSVRAPGHDELRETLVADRDRAFVISLVQTPAPRAIADASTARPTEVGTSPKHPRVPIRRAPNADTTQSTHPNRGNPLLPVSNEF
jgi:hypothetical protein